MGEDSRLGLWTVRSQQDMISAVAGVKHKPSDNEVVGASAVISERRGMERDYRNHLVRIMDCCTVLDLIHSVICACIS